ncbi:hypothetical protein [Novosphingobium percolationis]|uniref:hypothetical protein n=1 Tax=Novosphingobium percolationis TaxID=2871811 RepID=UPI001CD34190|nr:hypothetical protein [Novosphingobium percolationis]
MESVHLFYSWQSDRDSKLCRDFIARALAAAATRIEAARGIALRIDSDTAGVAGTPHITETILAKIRACDIFVGDMSFVGRADSGKLVTNPNVMVEYGYARHAKGDHRILLVMNAAFGSFRKLPFDLRHMRRPTEYSAAADIGEAALEATAAVFTDLLVEHLGIIVDEVLADRAVALEGGDIADKARAHLAELDAMAVRNDTPAIVPNPRLLVRLAPMNMPATAPFEFAQIRICAHASCPPGSPLNSGKTGPPRGNGRVSIPCRPWPVARTARRAGLPASSCPDCSNSLSPSAMPRTRTRSSVSMDSVSRLASSMRSGGSRRSLPTWAIRDRRWLSRSCKASRPSRCWRRAWPAAAFLIPACPLGN